MNRPGDVLSFAPRPRRPAPLRVQLLDGRATSHDPARSRCVLDELRRDPAAARNPIRPTFFARVCRWAESDYAAAVAVGILTGLLLAFFVVPL
jgi:hypothetical protein